MRSPNIPFVGIGINKHEVQRFSVDCSESSPQEFSEGDNRVVGPQ